jgi:hypothetical protein
MYQKLRQGDNLVRLYRNRRAASEVQMAYTRSRGPTIPRETIVQEMAGVIEGQIEQGVYLSRHLVDGAVDVRSRDLTRRQKRAFRAAVRSEPRVRVMLERRPPHFHLSFR